MKTLKVLLKQAEQARNTASQAAKESLEERNRILAALAASEASKEAEAAFFDGTPNSGLGFAAFLDIQASNRASLEGELEKAEADYAEKQAALTAAFLAQKRFETLISAEKAKAIKAEQVREQASFDEQSVQRFAGRRRSG